jgi:hypothetical protein
VQSDLEKLKKEMAELATVTGGLPQQDSNEVLARYRARGGTNAEAAGQYEREHHMGEGAGSGIMAGLRGYAAQFRNTFSTWKNFTTSVLGSVESSFSSFFDSVLTQGGSFVSKLSQLWKGLASSIIKALSDIMAKHLVTWGVEKTISAWKTAEHAKTIAHNQADTAIAIQGAAQQEAINAGVTASEVANQATQTTANEVTMAAKIYNWYASLGPWAIPAAAATIAAILVAVTQIGKVTAHAQGGIIDRPTLALMGEAGEPELVAPERSFRDWAAQLSGINFDLGSNFARHDAQVGRFNAQASGYSRAGLATYRGRVPQPIAFNNCLFAGSLEGRRAVARMVAQAQQDYRSN